jgi:hypothetical protein
MAESLNVASGYPPLLDDSTNNFVLLVTDGWQWCYPYDPDARHASVVSVQVLNQLGVETYVLGFGDGVDVLNNNLMADAGGRPLPNCNPNGEDPQAQDLCYHQTGNQQELEAAFDDIAVQVAGESCDDVDNDCDGYTDNMTPGSPDPLKRMVQDSCGSCLEVCVDGDWQPCSSQGPCDDQNACTVNDWCANDTCAGTPTSCSDGNTCTDDTCDPAQGCVYTNNSRPCDDGNVCTINDTCSQGSCRGTPSDANCNDNNPCTDDSCDANFGCRHEPNQASCDDGNSCTYNDSCQHGTCWGEPIACEDGDVCTDDVCDPAAGCRHDWNHARCDDGDPCTANDRCSNGVCRGEEFDCNNENICEHENCDDDNVCTDDSCDSDIGCVYEYNRKPCDDGDACTENDQCSRGTCQGTPFDCNPTDPCEELDCDDGNPCTSDSCDTVEGCVHANNSHRCDDDDICTYNDICSGGRCQGTPIDCNDGNPCTQDTCDPGPCADADTCDPRGCRHSPRSGECNDGDPCTSGDTCVSGMCQGGIDVCSGNQEKADIVTHMKPSGCDCNTGGTTASWAFVLFVLMFFSIRRRDL